MSSGLRRRTVLAAASLPLLGQISRPARAQASKTIKIGVLTDLSGTYRDTGGPTSVACARQAVEDFDPAAHGMQVEIIAADHQQKPDIGLGIVRQWFDQEGVDVVSDVNNSAIALAINGLTRDKDKVHLNVGAASSDLTGKFCTPNLVHWSFDTWEQSHSTANAILQRGGDTWFFITADYSFGHTLEQQATDVIKAKGGKVLGSVSYPFPSTTDFSALLLQAQSSGAKVIAFSNGSGDLIGCVKQANEFGLNKPGIILAGLDAMLTETNAIGLEIAQGLLLTETFYWDMNDRTRAFMDRVKSKTPTNWPNQNHAGMYASTLHYLKAVHAMGVEKAKASGSAAVAAMKAMPTDDDCFGHGYIRIDGRKIHPAYLFQVKTPQESKRQWDYYKLVSTTPAETAFQPLAETGCSLVKA